MTRIAINGFGRIGRAVVRSIIERDTDLEVVAVNDLTEGSTLAHLLKYDTVHGRTPYAVEAIGDGIKANGSSFECFSERDPAKLAWKDLDIDVVIEATGIFTKRDAAAAHIDAGARRVVISAPSPDADATVVMGVNHDEFDPGTHQIVSNASCTTNCLAPMVKVLHDSFELEQGFVTTVHAYTGDQALVDSPHRDLRRARAAAANIVPTSTGAARAIGQVLPALDGRLDGMAMRVPVPDGSITDLVATVANPASIDEVNQAFAAAAATSPLGDVLVYSDEPLVSSDIVGSPASCTFDSGLTMVHGDKVKIAGWYDNEWGYANRLVDLVTLVGRS